MRILVLQFIAQNIFMTLSTFFQSIQDTRLQKSVDFARMFFLMCIVCGLWFFDLHSIESYAWAWSIAMFSGLIFSIILLATKYHSYFRSDGWHFSF